MRRLMKSNDRVLSGVLGGIAEYLKIDPTLVRVVFAILTIVTGFGSVGIPLYIVLAIVMPGKSKNYQENPYYKGNDTQQGHPYGYNQTGSNNYSNKTKTRKEAENVREEDWSDF